MDFKKRCNENNGVFSKERVYDIFLLETIQIYINIEKEYKKKDEKSSNQRQLNYMKKHKKQTNTH